MRRLVLAGAATSVACALGAVGCATAPGAARVPASAPTAPRSRVGDDTASPRGPHASVSDLLNSHFSSQAWRDDVGEGYFRSSSALLPAALALAAGTIAPWDHTISSHASGSSTDLGNAAFATLLTGTAAVGLFAPGDGRPRSEELWTMGEAFALDLAGTIALKSIVGRGRPDSESYTSFPSGHTSVAFAAATLIDRNSGHGLGIPAYLLAATIGLSRVESRRHFPTDTLAGAALGVLCAGIVDSLHFGGDREEGGISRRYAVSRIGFGVGPGGEPLVTLTLLF